MNTEKEDTVLSNESISKNNVVYLLYNVLNMLFPFITGVYIANVLSPSSIGQISYAQNIVQYFVILSFLGIPTYGLREIANNRHDKNKLSKVHSELLIINFISTACFLGAYLILIFSIPDFYANVTLHLILGSHIFLNIFNNSWLYEGLEKFTYITILNLIFKVFSFTMLVLFVQSESDNLKYAFISVLGTAGNYITNIIYSKKYVNFTFKNLNFKKHLKPILYLVLVNLAIEIYSLVDTTMIGIFCADENVAFYTYGNRIYKVFLQLLNTFTIVVVPRLSSHYQKAEMDSFNSLISQTLRLILVLALPVIIGIQFVSEFFITQLYGQAYLSSAFVLRILSPILIIAPIGYLLGSRILLIAGKEKFMFLCVGIGAIVNIIGNIFLINLFDEHGASIASVISELVIAVVYFNLGKKYFKIDKRLKFDFLKIIIACCLLTIYLLLINMLALSGWLNFIIQVLGSVIIYFISLCLFKVEPTQKILNKLIRRG